MSVKILQGDVRDRLADLDGESIQCVVTSPPYWGLRDYGAEGQIGLEESPDEHVAELVAVFQGVRRVLRSDGVVWLNYGDCYAGSSGSGGATEKQKTNAGSFHYGGPRGGPGIKAKDLVGMPWRVAFALQADGWYLRADVIWHKPNPMPESVTDRPTKSHEHVFLLTKSARYHYDADAVRTESIGSWNSAKGFGSENKKSAGDPMLRTQGHGTFHDDKDKTRAAICATSGRSRQPRFPGLISPRSPRSSSSRVSRLVAGRKTPSSTRSAVPAPSGSWLTVSAVTPFLSS